MSNRMVQEQREVNVNRERDRALGLRFAAGDATAFDEVVRLYGPRLAGLVGRLQGWPANGGHDVQDALQEIFMTAYAHRRSFRSESSLLTWLTSISINTCRSLGRRQRVRWAALQRLAFWRGQTEPAAVAAPPVELDETAAQIQAAVRGLPARDREIIVLHYLEEYSVPQIAGMLRVSPAALHVRLHRARRRLGAVLGPLLGEDFLGGDHE